jgi:hypothetical protein
MKTKILIILAIIASSITIATARSNSPKGADGPSRSEWTIPLSLLAPATPAEATFDDATEGNSVTGTVTTVAPVTPEEATFEEILTGDERNNSVSTPLNQNTNSIDKGKTGRNAFPPPCSVKYGCSL